MQVWQMQSFALQQHILLQHSVIQERIWLDICFILVLVSIDKNYCVVLASFPGLSCFYVCLVHAKPEREEKFERERPGSISHVRWTPGERGPYISCL